MQLPGNDGVLQSYHIQNTMLTHWLVLIFDLRVIDEFSSYHVTFSWKGLLPTSLKVIITFTELKFMVKLPFHPVV